MATIHCLYINLDDLRSILCDTIPSVFRFTHTKNRSVDYETYMLVNDYVSLYLCVITINYINSPDNRQKRKYTSHIPERDITIHINTEITRI